MIFSRNKKFDLHDSIYFTIINRTTEPFNNMTSLTSLTYELNGRNDLAITKGDIGSIIGKDAQGLKKVISESWAMYERLQASGKGGTEQKPKLRIILTDHEEGVSAEIVSASPTMQKLCQRALDNHLTSIQQQKQNSSNEMIIEFPQRLLGMIIGKGGSGLKRLMHDAVYQDKKMMINPSDIETARTARMRIGELKMTSSKDIIDYVEKRSNRSFLGWPPSEEDDYEQHISITVSFDRKAKPFVDKELYLERLSEVITVRTLQVMNDDEDQMDEINECLGITDM